MSIGIFVILFAKVITFPVRSYYLKKSFRLNTKYRKRKGLVQTDD